MHGGKLDKFCWKYEERAIGEAGDENLVWVIVLETIGRKVDD